MKKRKNAAIATLKWFKRRKSIKISKMTKCKTQITLYWAAFYTKYKVYRGNYNVSRETIRDKLLNNQRTFKEGSKKTIEEIIEKQSKSFVTKNTPEFSKTPPTTPELSPQKAVEQLKKQNVSRETLQKTQKTSILHLSNGLKRTRVAILPPLT